MFVANYDNASLALELSKKRPKHREDRKEKKENTGILKHAAVDATCLTFYKTSSSIYQNVVLDTYERERSRRIVHGKKDARSHIRFYCRSLCVRLIDRENRGIGKAWIDAGIGMSRRIKAFLSRQPFYMPLDHSRAVLFLARLFAVDIYKDDGSPPPLPAFAPSPISTCRFIHATVVGGVLFRFL